MNTNIPKLNKTIRMLLDAYLTLGTVKDVPIPDVPIAEIIDAMILIYTRTYMQLEVAQKEVDAMDPNAADMISKLQRQIDDLQRQISELRLRLQDLEQKR